MLAGKTISFSVVATGAGPLAYQWSRDGMDIGAATSRALELSDVSAEDAGDYVAQHHRLLEALEQHGHDAGGNHDHG